MITKNSKNKTESNNEFEFKSIKNHSSVAVKSVLSKNPQQMFPTWKRIISESEKFNKMIKERSLRIS